MLLDKLAVPDPGDRGARDAHALARGRDLAEGAGVGRLHDPPRRDAVCLPQDDVDRDPQIREGGGDRDEVVLVALNPGDELRRIEPAVGGRDEALDAAGVFAVPDLLEMRAENGLGRGMLSFQSNARYPERRIIYCRRSDTNAAGEDNTKRRLPPVLPLPSAPGVGSSRDSSLFLLPRRGHGSQRYTMTAMLKKNVRHSYTATSCMAHLLLPTHGHYPVDQ
jgi:hypothetical protein